MARVEWKKTNQRALFADGPRLGRQRGYNAFNSKRWRLQNRERYKAGYRQWRESNPDARLAHERQRKYGMKRGQFKSMWDAQSGACAICGTEFESIRKAQVDHDHGSGNIRGLLCKPCNVAIGFMNDNPDVLRTAAKYLERASAKRSERTEIGPFTGDDE